MTDTARFYPIGTPGQPWGEPEKAAWRAGQRKQRSYADDVLAVIERLRERFDVAQYGELDYGEDGRYPLFALGPRSIDLALPWALVTGGVHGYETSGVHGALRFAERHAADYAGRINLLVAPCVSPWAYERIHRWNPHALDPNRNFRDDSPAGESAALWRLVAPLKSRFLVHVDLHFYLVDDSAKPQPGFQQAIIAAVEKVTHIAPADADGRIIGSPVLSPGVIEYAFRELGLCAGITDARFTTTTEVYPDSPRATPEQCIEAQVAAARAGLDYALQHAQA